MSRAADIADALVGFDAEAVKFAQMLLHARAVLPRKMGREFDAQWRVMHRAVERLATAAIEYEFDSLAEARQYGRARG